MNKFLVYILFLTSFATNAQVNLVPNGGFEEINIQPITFLPYYKNSKYYDIQDVLPNWKAPTNGTPDLFIIKEVSVPNDAVGYPIRWDKYTGKYNNPEFVNPNGGSNFVGINSGILIENGSNLIGFEFLQTALKSQLNSKSKYRLILSHRKSQSSSSTYPILSFYFSTNSISNYYSTSINNPNFTRFVPLVKNYTNITNSDTFWQIYSIELRPNQEFKHLTLGCFNLEFHPFKNDTFISAYYFIDDVSLIEIPCLVGHDTVCKNEQVTYYSTFAGPFSWWHKGIEVSTDSMYTFMADQGWYYLKTPNGEDSLYLTVLDELEEIADINDTICVGQNVKIDLPTQFKYNWQDGETVNYRIIETATNQYVSVKSLHCQDILHVTINMYPQNINNLPLAYKFCKDSFAFVDIELDKNGIEFLWADGQIGRTRKVFKEGNYKYQIRDTNGCLTDGVVAVEERCPAQYWIPNAFAPDGVNKTFKPYLKEISEATLIIYNRWGEKIYEQTAPNPAWNGFYQNQPCQPGIYFYQIKGKTDYNENVFLNGVVMVVK